MIIDEAGFSAVTVLLREAGLHCEKEMDDASPDSTVDIGWHPTRPHQNTQYPSYLPPHTTSKIESIPSPKISPPSSTEYEEA